MQKRPTSANWFRPFVFLDTLKHLRGSEKVKKRKQEESVRKRETEDWVFRSRNWHWEKLQVCSPSLTHLLAFNILNTDATLSVCFLKKSSNTVTHTHRQRIACWNTLYRRKRGKKATKKERENWQRHAKRISLHLCAGLCTSLLCRFCYCNLSTIFRKSFFKMFPNIHTLCSSIQ